jgi:ectoine hydroxylase-related dioxygenase (phytanoyl-CoA dioxygenase family)
LKNDCAQLQQLCGHLRPELTGSALDPFEFTNIEPTHSARRIPNEYIALRSHRETPSVDTDMISFILFNKIPSILRKVLGSESQPLFLFNEHYVVKEPDSDVSFRWHKDVQEQILDERLRKNVRYFSCWCTIDDVTQLNGTLVFPPESSIALYDMSKMESDLGNDLWGCMRSFAPAQFVEAWNTRYSNIADELNNELNMGDARNIPIVLPAGSMVIFSHDMWHCSGPNFSSASRRIFYCQYSLCPIHTSNDESEILSFAIPC